MGHLCMPQQGGSHDAHAMGHLCMPQQGGSHDAYAQVTHCKTVVVILGGFVLFASPLVPKVILIQPYISYLHCL